MKQEVILGILYELAMILGSEVRVKPLTERFLQRLLFHTDFPCGLFLRNITPETGTNTVRAILDTAIGDPALLAGCGEKHELVASLVTGQAELITEPSRLEAGPWPGCEWQSLLKLPVDAHSAFLLLSPAPIRSEAPLTTMFTPVLRNFARVRNLCEDNESHLRELERTNRELEAFIYSVSHDLRAPLRGIREFSDILVEEAATGLSAEHRDFLQRIHRRAEHMETLIDDLLKLSRSTQSSLTPVTVELSALAADIVTQLRERSPDRQVTVHITPGLTARVDPDLMRLALANLLENAWKYTGRSTDAVIEFGATQDASETIYYVQDNGVGFDMRYADKLFVAFQRLHGEQEFAGTGIGLATVQRVIERHGGRIWAVSAPGAGATFYFTLPAVD